MEKMKRYIAEHLADILVTRCVGAVYGWRFLETYTTLNKIFEPTIDHPSEHRRIRLMASEIRNQLQMPRDAKFLVSKLPKKDEEHLKKASSVVGFRSILEDALKEVRTYSRFALTKDQIKRSIEMGPWSRVLSLFERSISLESLDKLQDDLLRGKPIIVEPPVLYYIVTFNFPKVEVILEPKTEKDKKRSRKIKELMTDCIRLYVVQDQFLTNVEPLVPASSGTA